MKIFDRKSLQRYVFLLLFFLFSQYFLVSQENDSTIRIGVFQNEPLIFIDDHGQPQGVYADILREIAQLESWDLEFVKGSWAEGLERITKGEIDLMTSITPLESRISFMDFSTENIISLWGQVYTGGGKQIESLFDLQNKRVAILQNGVNGINLQKLCGGFSIKIEIVECDSYREVITQITEGNVFAGVVNNIKGYKFEEEFPIQRTSIFFSPFPLLFAAPKGRNSELIITIDNYISSWKVDEDSPYHRILNQWIYNSTEDISIIHWNLIILAAASILFMVTILLLMRIQINRKTKDLQKSREQYRAIVEDMPVLNCRCDKEYKIVFVNNAYCQFFSKTYDEMIGQNIFSYIFKEDRNEVEKKVELLTIENPTSMNINRNILENGDVRWIQWINRALFDKKGNRTAFQTIGQDITEIKKSEEELYKSRRI